MSTSDPRAGTPPTDESDVAVSELPTGTVTLLLADIEGSTRLWETQPDEMRQAVARFDRTLAQIIETHHGVRPVEQGEGDSLVVAFDRGSDAVACALDLQLAPLAPIRLRIGVHTGEVQLRDEGNYIGPTINRTARLRDLAHGGQTVLSGATEELVAEHLPPGAWLLTLGSHQLRDLKRAERVVQLCHPDLPNQFPPLRLSEPSAAQGLPVQFTSFIGRERQIENLTQLLSGYRLVTLTGCGGAGKTRLAVTVAARLADGFSDGARYVDLAPITDPDLAAATAARTLGLTEQPGRPAMDTLLRGLADRHLLLLLDNCEHLLDTTADLVVSVLGACPDVTILTTSREPIGVTGEAIWRVSSLSIADEAIELFTDRARLVRPDFTVTDENSGTVAEICQRLDGMPLAIELAAARVRALTLDDILAGLQDRFRMLTGGARTAVRRQQTLRASVDWSHALLTDVERVLFRRIAVFMGGFDLDAAQAVAADERLHSHQVFDEITLLVDKSLVVADNTSGRTRYRLLETVRQYALEKLGDSGEADVVRARHRDHYVALAAERDQPGSAGRQGSVDRVDAEIDNLRAAFAWSCDNGDDEVALQLASALQALWLIRGRIQEGLSWFRSVLSDLESCPLGVTPVTFARALADHALMLGMVGTPAPLEVPQRALAIARDIGDTGLLLRALTACGCTAAFDAEIARPYLSEAAAVARESDDRWRLVHVLWWLSYTAIHDGDPRAAHEAGREGRDIAEEIGDRFLSRVCRFWGFGTAYFMQGRLAEAAAELRAVCADAEADDDVLTRVACLCHLGYTLAWLGDADAGRAAAGSAVQAASEIGGLLEGLAYAPLATAALAAGDVEAAMTAASAAARILGTQPGIRNIQLNPIADVLLVRGDYAKAMDFADRAVSVSAGCGHAAALMSRARIWTTQGDTERAERDMREALTVAAEVDAHLVTPDVLECLAGLVGESGSHREAARLFGAAETVRHVIGVVRFTVWEDGYAAAVGRVREALGDNDFEQSWSEGTALSTSEAIAYALRGHGARKRPTAGWNALTPAERDVVRLLTEGLANKDIAARLFVSPRTVQSHLTHVYNKLGVSSRVQLVQEAARRN